MKLYFLLIVNLFLLASCKKYKPANAAFFMKASPVRVATNPATQGSGSHKITDLFLYVNGKFQGAYPVGNLMPIVTKNEKITIDVFAGIKNNGISDTRLTWIFYNHLTFDTLVENGKTIERPFTFRYDPNVKFEWLEDFDSNNGFSIRRSPISDTTFKIASAADSYEGKSVEIGLTGNAAIAQVETNIAYPLPTGSPNVYLEINYKCNQPFKIGVFGDSQLKEALIVNPQSNWNKIYVQLANVVSNAPVFSSYRVYFRMLKTDDNPNPKLFLDNIKLIHF